MSVPVAVNRNNLDVALTAIKIKRIVSCVKAPKANSKVLLRKRTKSSSVERVAIIQKFVSI